MSKVTCVQVCEFELLLKMLARVVPGVLRPCASCQAKAQGRPEHGSSAVAGRYQNFSVVVPDAGMATVWDTLLSPGAATADWTAPSNAELPPEWNWVLLAAGVFGPPVV